jgi:hypothetical protein
VHWNRYEPTKFRTDAQLKFYHDHLRPFAMYRHEEDIGKWEDADEKLGEWKTAFTTGETNPEGRLP